MTLEQYVKSNPNKAEYRAVAAWRAGFITAEEAERLVPGLNPAQVFAEWHESTRFAGVPFEASPEGWVASLRRRFPAMPSSEESSPS